MLDREVERSELLFLEVRLGNHIILSLPVGRRPDFDLFANTHHHRSTIETGFVTQVLWDNETAGAVEFNLGSIGQEQRLSWRMAGSIEFM